MTRFRKTDRAMDRRALLRSSVLGGGAILAQRLFAESFRILVALPAFYRPNRSQLSRQPRANFEARP